VPSATEALQRFKHDEARARTLLNEMVRGPHAGYAGAGEQDSEMLHCARGACRYGRDAHLSTPPYTDGDATPSPGTRMRRKLTQVNTAGDSAAHPASASDLLRGAPAAGGRQPAAACLPLPPARAGRVVSKICCVPPAPSNGMRLASCEAPPASHPRCSFPPSPRLPPPHQSPGPITRGPC
jgi:hypothetical protein